jgi:hypothetical protein
MYIEFDNTFPGEFLPRFRPVQFRPRSVLITKNRSGRKRMTRPIRGEARLSAGYNETQCKESDTDWRFCALKPKATRLSLGFNPPEALT